jgi:platelet-activating factor acetylhydrolase
VLTRRHGNPLIGSDQSFSDFPLLAPTSPSTALDYLSTIHELSIAFLQGRLAESDFIKSQKPDDGVFEKDSDGKMAGEKGSVILHLLAKA